MHGIIRIENITMRRVASILLLALLIIIAINDPALAGNKFTKIGGGVSGSSSDKIELLKSMRGILGGFMVLLGIIAFATRGRFEGLVGMVTGKRFEAVTIVPILLIILGSVLILTHYL
jgi:hypothetical protein